MIQESSALLEVSDIKLKNISCSSSFAPSARTALQNLKLLDEKEVRSLRSDLFCSF